MRFNYLKSGSSFVQNSMQAQVGTPDRKLGGGVLYGGKIEPPQQNLTKPVLKHNNSSKACLYYFWA